MAAILSNQKRYIRIVVAGDTGTGKSSFIFSTMSKKFPTQVPPVLPPSHRLYDFPARALATIIDTPSGPEHSDKRAEEFKRADSVVLTYACDRPDTFDNLSSYWLPELRRLKVKVPVLLVGCKFDLRDNQQQFSLWKVALPVMERFREIDSCFECSAYKLILATDIFCIAQKSVFCPTAPLLDQITRTLTPQFLKALKRIFILCDLDKDGALSDAEINLFKAMCFTSPLWLSTIADMKGAVRCKLPDGVNEHGLTMKGFFCLHEYFIEKKGVEMTWTVLRQFGYNNEIRLADSFLPSFKRAPDQSMELTNVALDFLIGTFNMYDTDNTGAIGPADVEDMFSTAPDCPWSDCPYMDAVSNSPQLHWEV